MLEQASLFVQAFDSSREFRHSCHNDERACLVLEVQMPDMDGLAVKRALGGHKVHLPIIYMTACGDVPTCARAFREGAVDFLLPGGQKSLFNESRRSPFRVRNGCARGHSRQ
jgi:FixJ family two-component response regulator